ncbi:MAG: MogA/MoaB family molybdenum cofactor biosynthesis protein [Clostridia bacterium]|nr:MogA/MoaB family molybdenum cofactor biosynthesis protein [Clostridia bacterium]
MYKAAVITVSDKCCTGERRDTSGPCVAKMLAEAGFEVIYTGLVPDEREMIAAELVKCSDRLGAQLVVSTGGTGLSPRDVSPEATRDVIEREIPAIPAAMLHYSLQITPRAMLSRAVAGVRGGTLIVNLPGSEKAARENLAAVIDALGHGIQMLGGGGHGN